MRPGIVAFLSAISLWVGWTPTAQGQARPALQVETGPGEVQSCPLETDRGFAALSIDGLGLLGWSVAVQDGHVVATRPDGIRGEVRGETPFSVGKRMCCSCRRPRIGMGIVY